LERPFITDHSNGCGRIDSNRGRSMRANLILQRLRAGGWTTTFAPRCNAGTRYAASYGAVRGAARLDAPRRLRADRIA